MKLKQFHRVWILVIMVGVPAKLNFIPVNDKFFREELNMEKVKLGSQGAIVSRMGLGCMGMSDGAGGCRSAE